MQQLTAAPTRYRASTDLYRRNCIHQFSANAALEANEPTAFHFPYVRRSIRRARPVRRYARRCIAAQRGGCLLVVMGARPSVFTNQRISAFNVVDDVGPAFVHLENVFIQPTSAALSSSERSDNRNPSRVSLRKVSPQPPCLHHSRLRMHRSMANSIGSQHRLAVGFMNVSPIPLLLRPVHLRTQSDPPETSRTGTLAT